LAYADFAHLKDKQKNEIQYCRNLKVGNKIKFQTEKQRYTVRAKSDRFIICTKPFNARKAFLYTIVDFERLVRGPVNLIFGLVWDFNIPEELEECLRQLEAEEVEVSHRRCIVLDVAMEVV